MGEGPSPNNSGHFAGLVTDNTTVGAGLIVGGQTVTEFCLLVEGKSVRANWAQRIIAAGHQDGAGDGACASRAFRPTNSAAGTRIILIIDGYLRVKRKHMLSNLIALRTFTTARRSAPQVACSRQRAPNPWNDHQCRVTLGSAGLCA